MRHRYFLYASIFLFGGLMYASATKWIIPMLGSVSIFPRSYYRPIDATITKDSSKIWNNKDALFSYVKKFGPQQTVQYLYKIGSGDGLGDCHQQAHTAGRFAHEIYGNKTFQLCSAECHSGCYHGAIEAFFREHGTADLGKNIGLICASEANQFESHQCFHGIGHGLTAWSDYDIPEALRACDLLNKGQASCHSGVFMENIVGGLAKEDFEKAEKSGDLHFTKYLNSDPQYPCNLVEEKYKGPCYFFQTSRMLQLFGSNFKLVAKECGRAPGEFYRRLCFESMGRDIAPHYPKNPAGILKECVHASKGSDRTGCIIGAINDIIWDPTAKDEALAFCASVTETEKEEKDACFKALFARASQVFPTDRALAEFCVGVEAGYRAQCPRIVQ